MLQLLLTLALVASVFVSVPAAQAAEWTLQQVERLVTQSDTAEPFNNIMYYHYPLPNSSGLVHAGMVTQQGKLHRGRDFWMAVTDNRGKIVWNFAWGDNGNQVAKFVELTTDSTGFHDGYIFVGYNREEGAEFGKFMAVSMSKSGEFRWMIDQPSKYWSSFKTARRVNWDRYELFGSQQDENGLWHAVKIVIGKNGVTYPQSREEEDWGNK